MPIGSVGRGVGVRMGGGEGGEVALGPGKSPGSQESFGFWVWRGKFENRHDWRWFSAQVGATTVAERTPRRHPSTAHRLGAMGGRAAPQKEDGGGQVPSITGNNGCEGEGNGSCGGVGYMCG